MGDLATDTNLVSVPIDRLLKLEELEKKLPSLIQEAIADYKKNNLKKLHEQDKNNPEGVRNRVRKYLLKNKDKINEKRREKRKEKLLESKNTAGVTSDTATLPINTQQPITTDEPYDDTLGVTVRFNT